MIDALVDFHMHSTCSDGSWRPPALFDSIRSREIEFFSISDHDNMDAYPVPDDLQPRCLPGLEIDTHYLSTTVHILAYGIYNRNCSLLTTLAQQRKNREGRACAIVAKLNEKGIGLTIDQVRVAASDSTSIGRPHVARALVAMNYCASVQEAFDKYLAEGADAYIPLDRLTTSEAICLVRKAGGVAILAHPRRIQNQGYLRSICELGIDGIEVIHPSADQVYQTYLLKMADDRRLLVTGGSDFHGRLEDQSIGVRIPRAKVELLLDRVSR